MAKIEAGTLQYFLINGIPKQRGEYEIVSDVLGTDELVGIRMVGRDGWVEGCELQSVTNYTDNTDTSIPTLAAFFVYVSSFMFEGTSGGGGGGTVDWIDITNKPVTFPPAPHTHPSTQISDSTSAGRALLTAADVVEQRTILGIEDPLTLKWASVRVATTGNITLGGLQAIDGVTLSANDRVLVWQQNIATENGIYLAQPGAWLRATDANETTEFEAGKEVNVLQGNTHASAIFINNTPDPVGIGSSNIVFAKSSAELPRVSQSGVILGRFNAGAGRVEEVTVSPQFTISGGVLAFLGGNIITQNGNSFGANVVIGSNDNFALQLETNGVVHQTISNDGRFGIGTAPVNSNRMVVQGIGDTFGTNALLVRNNSGSQIIRFVDDLRILVGGTLVGSETNNTGVRFIGTTGGGSTTAAPSTRGYVELGTGNTTISATTGNINAVTVYSNFNPVNGGSAVYNALSVIPVITQTAGATGTTRGILISPAITLSSAVDWRSIEFRNDIGRGLWGSGIAANALAGTLRIGTAANAQTNAQLQVDSTNRGFLPPRLTTAERDAVTWTATDEGMIIFNTTTKKHQGYDGTTWNDLY